VVFFVYEKQHLILIETNLEILLEEDFIPALIGAM